MPNMNVFLVVGTVLFLVLVVLYIFNTRRLKKKRESSIIYTGSKGRGKGVVTRAVYDFVESFFLTRRIVKRLRNSYEYLYPGDERRIIAGCMKVIRTIGAVILLSVIVLLLQDFSFFSAGLFLITVYLCVLEFITHALRRNQVTLLDGLERFITDVRHYYFEYEMVDEAINEAVNDANVLMRLHGTKIYDVITSPDQESAVISYNNNMPNRFLRTFLANCTTVMKYGDTKVDGESLFLMNLRDLKREISIEKNRQKRDNRIFTGVFALCLAPLYAMPFAKNWCIGIMPSLFSLYNGAFGTYLVVALFAIILFVYHYLVRLKEGDDEYTTEHPILDYLMSFQVVSHFYTSITNINYGRTLRIRRILRNTGAGISVEKFYLRRTLWAILGLVFSIAIFFYGHEVDKYNYLTVVTIDGKVSNALSNKDYEVLEPTILEYINRDLRAGLDVEEITEQIEDAGVFHYITASEFSAQQVYDQIAKYHAEYFEWYELLISLLVAAIAFFVPYLLLYKKEKALQMQMDDEVIQFQSVILMLIHLPNVTVETLLQWMCDFSVIFRASLMECIDNYSYGDQAALAHLLESEPHIGFQRIVKNLIACDRIGVEAAFTEISSDRQNYQETRKQENEIASSKKQNRVSFLIMVPTIAVIFLYLIVPFVYGAVTMYGDMQSMFAF